MKFSFINASPNEGVDASIEARRVAPFPPLGILYLAAVLQQHDMEVSVLDQPAKGLTVEETVKWAEKENPDILGFSAIANSGRTAASICEKVRERNPSIVTIFGNHYATFNPERVLLKYPSVDIVVRGEGESTLSELASCIKKGGSLKEVRGITFRDEKRIISTPDRPLIGDLDSLPFPDRKLVDGEYHCMIIGANVTPKKFTSIVSSRGCVYRCRFCICSCFARNRWRARSVRNTLEELRLLVSDGYRQFIFTDDSFTTNNKRVVELCRAIRNEKMDIDWICEGRVDNCSYEMLWELSKAGCKIIYLGIESANQRILDYYNKQITPRQSETAVKTARKAGMDLVIGSFILGAPDERREEIQNTINFAKQVPIDIPHFNILGAYPGMDLWNELEAKGFLNEEKYWETGVAVPEISPSAVPINEIKQMVRTGFYDFIKRPSYLLEEVARTLKSSYRINSVLSNLSKIGSIIENARNVV